MDPAKVKAIQEMPAPRTEKEVRGFLGRLNYIARFISHLTATCEPIFKLLKKEQVVRWNDECQAAFERIKEYLQEPPILMPPVIGGNRTDCFGMLVRVLRCFHKECRDKQESPPSFILSNKERTKAQKNSFSRCFSGSGGRL